MRTCPTCGFTASRWSSPHFDRWHRSCKRCHAEGRAHFRTGHKAPNTGRGKEHWRVKRALEVERKGHRILTQAERRRGAQPVA